MILSVAEPVPMTGIEKMSEDTVLQRSLGVDGVEYALKMAARAKVAAESIHKEGPVTGEIVYTASKIGAEMIVMGASDPKGIPGLLLGNIAEEVVKRAACTVLVIRPTESEVRAIMDTISGFKGSVKTIEIADITGSAKFKLGAGLFAIYALGYSLFTLVGSFDKQIFGMRLLGLNIALISGMTLIVVAIGMAILYNWYVARSEKGTAEGASP